MQTLWENNCSLLIVNLKLTLTVISFILYIIKKMYWILAIENILLKYNNELEIV